MKLDEKVQDIVVQSMAAEILKSLDTEVRDKILQKSISDALNTSSFKRAIEKIIEQVRKGFEQLMSKLPTAVEESLAETLFGNTKSQYYTLGLVARKLSKGE